MEAARATLQRIQADIDDSVLKSPRDGRVQYRVAQPGEVLSPGGVVLNMVDLILLATPVSQISPKFWRNDESILKPGHGPDVWEMKHFVWCL